MNGERQIIVISIAEYLKKLWKWAAVIICWSVFCATAAVTCATLLKDTVFTADTSIYILARNVYSEDERLDLSDIEVSTQMIHDGMLMMTSEQMAERVVANYKREIDPDTSLTARDILDMVSVTQAEDSLLVTIAVTYADPYMACDLANIYRETASVELEAKLRARGIQTIEEALIPLSPSGRSMTFYAAVGTIFGIVSAIVLLFVLYLVFDAKRMPEDIKAV